jgi:hypothetical protein
MKADRFYKVVFGDLSVREVTTEELAELEALSNIREK